MNKIEVSKTIRSWRGLVELDERFSAASEEWVFRGEAIYRTPKTSLQRVCEQFEIDSKDVSQLERVLVKEFRRVYPIYEPGRVPDADDAIHWLSLMRHYGTPTRFLDFTFSLLIAAFFALEAPVKSESAGTYMPAAIWAVSKTWLTRHMLSQLRQIGPPELISEWDARKGRAFEKIFWNHAPPLKTVLAVNPLQLHERLHVQQGVFLCPGDVSISFEQNLIHLAGWRSNAKVFLIDQGCRHDVLWKLRRAGISRESLFPGLEGFSESLRVVVPLLFRWYKKMERKGGRIPTNSRNEFLYDKFDTAIA